LPLVITWETSTRSDRRLMQIQPGFRPVEPSSLILRNPPDIRLSWLP